MDTSQSTASSGTNHLFINTDTSKIFLGGQKSENESYVNNSTYDPITLYAGTVMGRISGTDIVIPWRNDVSDGSQYPIGILMSDLIIDQGDTVKAPICVSGDVAAEKVIAYQLSNQSTSTTLQLTISSLGGRRLKDILESIGIHLKYGTEMSAYDNS